MPKYTIRPKVSKFSGIIAIVIGVVFLIGISSIFSEDRIPIDEIGAFRYFFYLIPGIIILSGIFTLFTKDASKYSYGYEVDVDNSVGNNTEERIKKLKDLRDQYLITEEEYQKQLEKILSEI